MFSGFGKPAADDPPPPELAGSGGSAASGAGLGAFLGNLGGRGSAGAAATAAGRQPLLASATSTGSHRSVKRMTAQERMARYIEVAAQLSESRAPQVSAVLRALAPVFSVFLHFGTLVVMGYARLYQHVYSIYQTLPVNEMQMVIGLLLCFFGGTYVTLIAAVEAFRTMGGQGLYEQLMYVWSEVESVVQAQHKDDRLDEDRDGIADVDQLTPEKLTQRKVKVAMVSIRDPALLQSAVGSLWSACLAVLATLKLQFAQTAAYALAIAEQVKFPILRATAPALTWSLGPDLQHWTDPILDSTLKALCIMLVWYLEKVRAAFYSGLRGGRLFAEAALAFGDQRGWIDKLPDSIATKPFDPDQSYLDEAIAFSLAAVGFYWQVSNLFFIPFPLDWVLWPVSFAEYFLEIQVAWAH